MAVFTFKRTLTYYLKVEADTAEKAEDTAAAYAPADTEQDPVDTNWELVNQVE